MKGIGDFVHIRKPDSPLPEVRALIETIPAELHPKLKLHDHFSLIEEFDLGGVHLNSRNPVAPQGALSVSKSFHSLDELKDAGQFDYVTLSPVFDSISKQGYRAAFDFDDLKKELSAVNNVIALGGITPDKFQLLKSLGFSGAALLSYYNL